MKFVLLGSINAQWAGKQAVRTRAARLKARQLGMKIETVLYTQGEYDFIDIAEAPDAQSVLSFSIWYARKGLGRIQTLPAFDEKSFMAAVAKA